MTLLAGHGLAACPHVLGTVREDDLILFQRAPAARCIAPSRTALRTIWGETSWQMQRLRDNPACADQEHAARQDATDPGLQAGSPTTRPRTWLRPISPGVPPSGGAARAGSTPTWRWRPPSTAPASPLSTCT